MNTAAGGGTNRYVRFADDKAVSMETDSRLYMVDGTCGIVDGVV